MLSEKQYRWMKIPLPSERPAHTHGGVRFAGAVYIFVREGNKWEQQAKLTHDDPGKASKFGGSVSLTFNTVVIGAPLHDTERGRDAGAAYIFVRNGGQMEAAGKIDFQRHESGRSIWYRRRHHRQKRHRWCSVPP